MPSNSKYKYIVSNNLIVSSSINADAINRATHMFGEPTPSIKGTMVRTIPITHKIQRILLPLPIAQRHREIQLYIDFCFINEYPFLHTKSGKINSSLPIYALVEGKHKS